MSPKISISLLGAQTDQRLLALASEGHERAFEALVQRYRRPLLRYCRRLGLSDARGEDVLQQAFLQAWLALARGAEVRELRAWLYRIVHNAAVNAMRGPAELHGELSEAVQARAALVGESNLERMIAVREALTEVAQLPRMQRQAIFLTAVDGQSHDEVASALGISHGALRGLLYRARATLRSAAAALTPPPLLEWAAGGGGAAGPAAERLAELTAGSGAAGFAGVLLKGAVVAVTAGALATGAGVLAGQEHAGISAHRGVSADTPRASVVALPSAGGTSSLGKDITLLAPLAGKRANGGRYGEDAHRRSGRPERAAHRRAGERDAPLLTSDVSANGRGGDSGGDGEDFADRHGTSAATGTRSGSSGRGSGEPLATDGAKASTGGGGSGGDGSSSGLSSSERARGQGSAAESGGGDGSAGSGGSGGGTGHGETEVPTTSGLDSPSSAGSPSDESASAGGAASSGSASSGEHGGSGSDG